MQNGSRNEAQGERQKGLHYAFLDTLRQLPFVDAIYLFGSRARGDAGEKSDIDLALVCPRADARDWDRIQQVIEVADTLLFIDAVRYDTLNEDDPLKKSIDRDKVVLFQRHA